MAPRFRADQVGSLIRPQALLALHKTASEGIPLATTSSEETKMNLQSATAKAIADVVQKQLDLCIRPITSGEYERSVFYEGFFEKLRGNELRNVRVPEDFRPNLPISESLVKAGIQETPASITTGKIEHVEPAYLHVWEMLKKGVPQEHWKDCKIALPSPTWQHVWLSKGRTYSSDVYSSDQEYFADLTAAYRAEIRILYDAGLRNLQVDDPQLLYFILESFTDGLRSEAVDPSELLDTYIWALNEVVRDRPEDLYVGVHICRGNIPGSNTGVLEGSYESIAEKLFRELDYDTFYLEFDDARSGSFEPLRFLPQGKTVTLGLISTKTPELEDLDELRRRVQDAATVIASGQKRTTGEVLEDSLAVSPQCGFASAHHGKNVGSEERMWDKLVLVRDLARSIWSGSS
ncbi:uncharacterized protein N0V89_006001 [Didymosphaeria variabile]|uniref:Cobalamin-independent methionine synthase MetE C-terminal/archaeal domain-containing protein n=1 Tax=Didymosphaeria variabile TaxID=1932322 RepID=A0A9W8XLS4_9PLEO|nr:uncharacterized protein N0V89_006001 [Didymosphaeria variabile]KAJ4354267.1 hypothetical protein N0V89_006001 [Didymosphaeria variabile]